MQKTAYKQTGGRGLTVKVKTARGRKMSSLKWLQRQLNDPYVNQAQAAGYRSRAAFKLTEMNEKYTFLKPGKRILDLGAAPGGWSQVAAKYCKSEAENPTVLGIDLQEMEPIPGVNLVQMDFMTSDAPEKILSLLDGHLVDVVLSDMAAPAVGHPQTDHLRTMALAEAAYDFAKEVLAPKGAFIAKVLQGGTERDLLTNLKQNFEIVKHVKPPASRKDSSEMYVLALGFKS